MNWMTLDSWIVLTAVAVAVACVIPGCFLFLSKQSMMSHGIAHAVLPGIVLGHLATGAVETPALFIGAVVAGVACALLTNTLRHLSEVGEGAALGIAFTTLFAVGLVLQRLLADNVHIEPSHVLMGNLETAVFDLTLSEGRAPEAFWRALIASEGGRSKGQGRHHRKRLPESGVTFSLELKSRGGRVPVLECGPSGGRALSGWPSPLLLILRQGRTRRSCGRHGQVLVSRW